MFCPEDRGNLNPVALREIKLGEPQLMVDDYLIENRFDSNVLSATVPHVLHQGKRTREPIVIPDKPWEAEHGIGHPDVVYDPDAKLFRLYYTVPQKTRGPGRPPGGYFLCYAESKDGVNWVKPVLGLFGWEDVEDTNIIMEGEHEAKIANVHITSQDESDGKRNLGFIPPGFLKGHNFVMYYCDGSHYLATSEDGIHWNERASKVIANRIDCYHTIVYDENREEFVSFLRNKLIFSGKQPEDYYGNTRMVSRVSGTDLWSEWDTMPTSVLIPDLGDAKRFYGMPTFRYGGIYWGFLQHFDENPQTIEIELAFSRDGLDWKRLPGRPKILAVGEPGSWDGGMVSTGDRVIEVGDEWWVYYVGNNGYHDAKDRQSQIGLLKFRKEGFVSLSAGDIDSYVLTRPIRWPGGHLEINSNSKDGFLRVRITDQRRNTIEGFNYDQCISFTGDNIRHRVAWEEGDISRLEGSIIRLEFKFRNSDLFAFVAQEDN
jgi:hypothetical protein